MEKKTLTMAAFWGSLFRSFGVTTMFLTFIGIIFGGSVQADEGYSALFRMGKEGITYDILLEFFAAILIIQILSQILFSEKLKHIMFLWRAIILLFLALLVICGFIVGFRWFPITSGEAWFAFFISFGLFFGVSAAAVVLKNKAENKEYEVLFEKYKKELNSVSQKEKEESHERD